MLTAPTFLFSYFARAEFVCCCTFFDSFEKVFICLSLFGWRAFGLKNMRNRLSFGLKVHIIPLLQLKIYQENRFENIGVAFQRRQQVFRFIPNER
jgi:hypothetical protein